MSPELAEFSELIDEHFELVDTEPEDFWQMIINMFIWVFVYRIVAGLRCHKPPGKRAHISISFSRQVQD